MSDGFVEQRHVSERRRPAERRGGADRRLEDRRLLIQWVSADARTGRDRRIRERRAIVARRRLTDRRGGEGDVTLPTA